MSTYAIAIILGSIFAGLFLYARSNRHWIQSQKEWDRMLAEKDNKIINEELGVEYKFGDVLLLLPLQAGDEDKWGEYNLAKYLTNVSGMLYQRLHNTGRLDDDHTIMKIIKNVLTYDNISNLMESSLKLMNMRYLHTEIYLGGGWTISALGIGLRLRKLSKTQLAYYDVYRYKEQPIQEEPFLKVCKKHWNKEYDSLSMSLSGALMIFGIKSIKDKKFKYDSEDKVMCSEFGSRLYNEYTGLNIFGYPEHTIPDDFATKEEYFENIYWNKNVDRQPYDNTLDDNV